MKSSLTQEVICEHVLLCACSYLWMFVCVARTWISMHAGQRSTSAILDNIQSNQVMSSLVYTYSIYRKTTYIYTQYIYLCSISIGSLFLYILDIIYILSIYYVYSLYIIYIQEREIWNSLNESGWLTDEPWRLSCFCLFITEITNVLIHIYFRQVWEESIYIFFLVWMICSLDVC